MASAGRLAERLPDPPSRVGSLGLRTCGVFGNPIA